MTILGYDEDRNLVYQENPDETTRTWTYTTTFHQVASATDELNRTVSFEYDTDGNLTEETDAVGNETTHVYNSDGLVTSTTTPDPDGTGPLAAAVTSFTYDTNGRLTKITHPDTSTYEFEYDSADNVTTETDELDNDATFTYDALDRLTSETDREDATVSYEYDAIGQLVTLTDSLDGETDYEYNGRGWVTKVTQPDPDGVGSLDRPEIDYVYDATGNRTTLTSDFNGSSRPPVIYTYNSAGQLTKKEGPLIGDYTSYTFDNLGRLTSEWVYSHLKTEYVYDSLGRTTEVKKSDGYDSTPPTMTYGYDDAGQLTSVTDPRGYTTSYEYNSRGLVIRETLPDPDGSGPMFSQVIPYQYDNLGRLTNVYGMYTRVTTLEYDNRDRVTKVKLPDANDQGESYRPVITYSYDDAGNKLTETDPLGNVTTYTYDKEGRVKTITGADPDGAGSQTSPVTNYAYDDAGNVTSITDPLGGVTSYEFDALSRQTKLTEEDPDDTGPLSAPVTTYEYNSIGKLSKVTDAESRETTIQYDTIGRRDGVTDDSGNKTSYGYDNYDNVTSITQPDPDGAGPLTASVTSYQYDVFDRRTRMTDAVGGITDFTYDDAGNVLTIEDPVNNTTSFAYDGMGRVTIETNELNKTRSFEYGAPGNLSRRTDRNGRVIQYTHDNLERLTDERWYTNATPTPSLEITTDTEGGLNDEVQRVGFSGTVFGGTFTLTHGANTTSALSYNSTAAQVESALEALASIGSGNVSVTKSSDYSTTEYTITFQGTKAGTDVSQTTISTTGLSGYGITKIEATDTAGGSVSEVQEIDLENANGGTFRLAFNGETTAALDHDSTAAEVDTALDDLNSVDTVTVTGSAGGPWTVTFTGTHAGNNVASIMGDATSATSGTLDRTISFTYNKASQITAASDPDSGYDYIYDNLGRLLTVDNDDTPGVPRVILSSVYDANGNRAELSATIDGTDDFLNSYTYDALNRLTRLDQIGQTGGNAVGEKRVDLTYEATGRFKTIARYSDTDGGSSDEIATSSYSYDGIGRLTGLDYEQGGTGLFTPYSWTHDDAGRITQFVSADGTTDFTYDKTSQLTDADHDYQSDESYSYDANGNRTNTGYSTGDDNRLTNDGTYSYEYDDEGNRTKRTDDSTYEETVYEWDFRNRLVEVTEKDEFGDTNQVVEYTYDIFNRRLSKSVDTTSPFDMADAAIEFYVYDDLNGVSSVVGGNVVLDFVDPDGDGATAITLESRQLYGNAVDRIFAQEDVTENVTSADRVLWHLVDHLGTVRDLAKNDGTLGEHYEYDSYGNIESGDTLITRYLYTSREHDPETGLQYSRARWYDAAVGQWLSSDPLGFEAGDTNLRRYVGNNPTNATDPSGMFDWPVDDNGDPYIPPPSLSPANQTAAYGGWQTFLILRRIVGHMNTGYQRAMLQRTPIPRNTGNLPAMIVPPVDPEGSIPTLTGADVQRQNIERFNQFQTEILMGLSMHLAMTRIFRSTQAAVAPYYRGGAHWRMRLPPNNGLQSHHMPHRGATRPSVGRGPAIQMSPKDHAKTSSFRNTRRSQWWRTTTNQMIANGQTRAMMAREIHDVRRAAEEASNNRRKYNKAIQEMLEYAKEVWPELRKGD